MEIEILHFGGPRGWTHGENDAPLELRLRILGPEEEDTAGGDANKTVDHFVVVASEVMESRVGTARAPEASECDVDWATLVQQSAVLSAALMEHEHDEEDGKVPPFVVAELHGAARSSAKVGHRVDQDEVCETIGNSEIAQAPARTLLAWAAMRRNRSGAADAPTAATFTISRLPHVDGNDDGDGGDVPPIERLLPGWRSGSSNGGGDVREQHQQQPVEVLLRWIAAAASTGPAPGHDESPITPVDSLQQQQKMAAEEKEEKAKKDARRKLPGVEGVASRRRPPVITVECDGIDTITILEHAHGVADCGTSSSRVSLYNLLSHTDREIVPEHRELVAAMRRSFATAEVEEEEGEGQEEEEEQEDVEAAVLGKEDADEVPGAADPQTRAQFERCAALLDELREALHGRCSSEGEEGVAATAVRPSDALEVTLAALLAGEPLLGAARPTLVGVVHNSRNIEIDLVRQEIATPAGATGGSGRVRVERVPMTLAVLAMEVDRRQKELAQEREALEQLQQSMQAEEEATAKAEVRSAGATGGVVEIDAAQRRRRRLLAHAAVRVWRAEAAWARWRESQAVVQFALEVYLNAEANANPIADDSQRLQLQRILRTVRANVARLDEALRANQSGLDAARSVAEKDLRSAERVALFRELELLRGSEGVLEACIVEKRHLLSLLRHERDSVYRSVAQTKDCSREKAREATEALAKGAALRKERDALANRCDALTKSLAKEKEHSAALQRHVDALRHSTRVPRRGGGAAADDPAPRPAATTTGVLTAPPATTPPLQASPYDIAADPLRKPRLASQEEEGRLIDRLYARPLKKILAPEGPTFKSRYTPPPVEPEHANQRLYYQRKDAFGKQQSALRAKYAAVIADTSPKIGSNKKITTRAALEDNVERLLRSPLRTRDEGRKKLFAELVEAHEPRMARRSAEERAQIAERLYAAASAAASPKK